MSMTRVDRITLLLSNQNGTKELNKSTVQSIYLQKLQSDLDRTRKFLQQAEQSISELKVEQEDRKERKQNNEANDASKEQIETKLSKIRLLALYEMYKQLPYLALKNDLIGIATAATLTAKAVNEQSRASKHLEAQNEQLLRDVQSLEGIVSDYQSVNKLLLERIQNHPQKIADLKESIKFLESLVRMAPTKIELSCQVNNGIKIVEDTLYAHVQRLVVKLHAMMDWETTSIADEQTFRNNIIRSSTFIKTLVVRLVESDDPLVLVVQGSPEDHLAKLLVQHDIVQVSQGQLYQVSLRNYNE